MNVGDVVVGVNGPRSGDLCCGSGTYTHAICVSVEPFVCVSEEGDMMWSCLRRSEVVALCEASPKARREAFKRFKREQPRAVLETSGARP